MVDITEAGFQKQLTIIQDRMSRAAISAGRLPDSVKLVVVTKRRELSVVRNVALGGGVYLGENYPEEAIGKIEALGIPFPNLKWHMIGHIQSRKADIVAKNFDMVHSLDRLKVASRLDLVCKSVGRVLPVLLQFNVSGESSKWGWPAWDESAWSCLIPDVEKMLQFESLQVKGVMTMPPLSADPQDSRPYFVKLRRLQGFLQNKLSIPQFDECSMGTSGDFEVAIEEGATYVRVGEALLGKRKD